MTGKVRYLAAGAIGLTATFVFNRIAVWWLGATLFTQPAFYDGCAGLLTLAIPALLGGLLLGWVAREEGLNVAAITFLLLCGVSFMHPLWRIPPVSRHTGAMHYFLYSPLVALAFGSLGGWFSSQFAIGKFTLSDEKPVFPEG